MIKTRLKILISVLIAILLATSASRATELDDALLDLSPSAKIKLQTSIQSFLKLDVKPDRSANDLGWDCLAAISLIDRGVVGAQRRLSDISVRLLSNAVRDSNTKKILGWSAASPEMSTCQVSDASAVSTKPNCEGNKTTFAFQTGLGIACLSRAGEILKQTEYIEASRDAMSYWKRLIQPIRPCPQCIYFATSDSAKHDERYIRNMNLFMSYGAAELGSILGSFELKELSKRSAQSDVWERDNGNKGYLSRLDPLWQAKASESDRIENHSAAVALLLRELGIKFNDPTFLSKAVVVYKDWATCDNERCKVSGCKYWAGNPFTCQATLTATHCAFRDVDEMARMNCEKFLQIVPRVNSYGLWASLQARSLNPEKKH